MKAKELNRQLPQYMELFDIDEDEFTYAISYELAIRAAKDYLIEKLKVFYISDKDGLLYINIEEFTKQYGREKIDEITEIYTSNNEEMFFYAIEEITDDFSADWGIVFSKLYLDYHFIPINIKQLFSKIAMNYETYNSNVIEKTIYDTIKTKTTFYKSFTRTEKRFHNPSTEIDKIEYLYRPNYIRPKLIHHIDEHKSVEIEIDINLPKNAIMTQISKLVDVIKEDTINILSKKAMIYKSIAKNHQIEYKEILTKPYKHKGEMIDMLIAYDYLQLRIEEVKIINEQNNAKKIKETKYIKHSYTGAEEKKALIKKINNAYKKITVKDTRTEIGNILNIQPDTVRKYIQQINRLIKEKNYLQIINGVAI